MKTSLSGKISLSNEEDASFTANIDIDSSKYGGEAPPPLFDTVTE